MPKALPANPNLDVVAESRQAPARRVACRRSRSEAHRGPARHRRRIRICELARAQGPHRCADRRAHSARSRGCLRRRARGRRRNGAPCHCRRLRSQRSRRRRPHHSPDRQSEPVRSDRAHCSRRARRDPATASGRGRRRHSRRRVAGRGRRAAGAARRPSGAHRRVGHGLREAIGAPSRCLPEPARVPASPHRSRRRCRTCAIFPTTPIRCTSLPRSAISRPCASWSKRAPT